MSCSIRISVTSPVEREQHLRELHPLAAREAGGRLVEHHQLRLARQRHADLELALLPVREVADGRRRAAPSSPTRSARSSRARSHLGRHAGQANRPQVPRLDAQDRQVEVVLDREAEEESRRLVRAGQPETRRAVRAGRIVTSRPNSSIVPVVGGNSPAMTLNSVVLPAPFGPRIARRSPGRDVEVDVSHGLDAAEAPADPPQAEDRLGALVVAATATRASSRSTRLLHPGGSTVQIVLHALRVLPVGSRSGRR